MTLIGRICHIICQQFGKGLIRGVPESYLGMGPPVRSCSRVGWLEERDRRKRSVADFVKAARTTEIGPGQARLVEVKGKQIALFNVDSQFFALDNTCTPRGGPLADGEVSGHVVTCPWHRATFVVLTGEGVRTTARRSAVRYGVRVTGTDVEVEV